MVILFGDSSGGKAAAGPRFVVTHFCLCLASQLENPAYYTPTGRLMGWLLTRRVSWEGKLGRKEPLLEAVGQFLSILPATSTNFSKVPASPDWCQQIGKTGYTEAGPEGLTWVPASGMSFSEATHTVL